MTGHAAALRLGLDWLTGIVSAQVAAALDKPEEGRPADYPDMAWLPPAILDHAPDASEVLVLMLALAPHVEPAIFDKVLAGYFPDGGDILDFGGVRGTNHRCILPTGQTALFLLAGEDLERRAAAQRLFANDHWFARKRILWIEPARDGEPAMAGRLVLDPEVVEEVVTGKVSPPAFSMDFPAEHIETKMDWDDLVLNPATLAQIQEIQSWITHNDTLLRDWGMAKRLKPGYRALFHGPPGTGKTLTAMLLGKHTGKDVFRIDLSRVVSKYIGETEKNLSRLFDKAEHKDWILFFDEADALFGKRTDIRDAHDKYANQEVAYLLQRIEGYNGLVILASNQRANIDDAFVRRLQTITPFPMPRPSERLELWRKTFPPQIAVADDVDWRTIATRHELTGAGILNVTHFCAIDLLAKNTMQLDLKSLEAAIQREYVKEGKVI
jgi:hypothetical protein